MATVHVEMGAVMGGGAPVYSGIRASQTITSSGSNQVSTIIAESGEYARITAGGGAVYVAVGKAASSDPRRYLLAGQTIDIGPLSRGNTINIIDAP